MNETINKLSTKESIYKKLLILETLKKEEWFSSNWEKESTENKKKCILDIISNIQIPTTNHIGGTRKPVKSAIIATGINFIDAENLKRFQRPKVIGEILHNLCENQSEMTSTELLLQAMSKISTDTESEENSESPSPRSQKKLQGSIHPAVNASGSNANFFTTTKRGVDAFTNAKGRLSLRNHTFMGCICLFQAQVEKLLRSFTPVSPWEIIDLSSFVEAHDSCCQSLANILLLVSMQKSENATEPPPKEEQLLLHHTFQLLDLVRSFSPPFFPFLLFPPPSFYLSFFPSFSLSLFPSFLFSLFQYHGH